MSRWIMKNKKPVEDMSILENSIHPLILKLLYNRDVNTVDKVMAFLKPNIELLPSPLELYGVAEAVKLINTMGDAHIRVVGDYDVDGTMGTYILVDALKQMGFFVDYTIPHRVKDGYGINRAIVDTAFEDGVDLIITVDNGIVAMDVADYCSSLGLRLIITDHHEPLMQNGEMVLPKADVVIDPKRADFPYKTGEICGAYVAYKLAFALTENTNGDVDEFTNKYLGFAALATVCDIMDLKEENRIVVTHGTKALENTRVVGMRALFDGCGIQDSAISAYHMGFIIGPTINAAGRLGHAKDVLELMFENEEERAKIKVNSMRELNSERIEMTEEGTLLGKEIVNSMDLKKERVLVIHLPDIHESVAGIIAGKLKDEYCRPVFVLTGKGDTLKGSGRSIDGYNMIESLRNSDYLLSKYGGHELAAGLTLSKLNLEDFRQAINESSDLTDSDLVEKINVDSMFPFFSITVPMLEAIAKLGPFGKGNPTPIFSQLGVHIESATFMGKDKNVLKLSIKDRTTTKTGIMFSGGEEFVSYILKKYDRITRETLLNGNAPEAKVDIVFRMQINEFRGNKEPQIIISHYR